jgi:hypothetical protein
MHDAKRNEQLMFIQKMWKDAGNCSEVGESAKESGRTLLEVLDEGFYPYSSLRPVELVCAIHDPAIDKDTRDFLILQLLHHMTIFFSSWKQEGNYIQYTSFLPHIMKRCILLTKLFDLSPENSLRLYCILKNHMDHARKQGWYNDAEYNRLIKIMV